MELKEIIISEALKIRELEMNELSLAFPVITQLRPHLASLTEFTDAVKIMKREGYRIACLFENGQIVTYAGFARLYNLYYGDHIGVYELVTDSAKRGMGYGAMVLSYIEQFARDNSLKCVALSSGLQRVDAHRFYENAGYDKVSFVFQKECRNN